VERGALRTFALPRIGTVTELKVKFPRPEDFSPEKFFASALGVLGGDGDHRVVIRFDATVAERVREREWHESQEMKELPGGRLELRLHLGALMEVEQWVLGWGAAAEVLGPSELRASVRQTVAALARLYAE
jgi:proteasome accessory factor B